jgi:hypothetical protein
MREPATFLDYTYLYLYTCILGVLIGVTYLSYKIEILFAITVDCVTIFLLYCPQTFSLMWKV